MRSYPSNQTNRTGKISKIVLFFLFLIAILIRVAIIHLNNENFHINFLDVGQGDAIHIRKDNIDILIDGGPNDDVLEELGKTMPFYDRTIEYVFLTHPDADHVSGLVDVIESYEVKNIYLTGVVKDTSIVEEFIRQIEANKIPVKFVKAEDRIEFGNEFYIFIFWPKEVYATREVTNINNTSIVGQVNYKNISILLAGDVENDVQQEFIHEYRNKLKSDILKIAHHGAKNGTNEELLHVVNPEIAVISVGVDNHFGRNIKYWLLF